MQHLQAEKQLMTFDEVSMERSRSFMKALQELKNLRPQLYSAAEYCEKSYVHNEQKQMVLDNLKDYTVRALVNAVDHLGTVAYKLTDLFEQQTLDISAMDLKVTCLDQRLETCQSYTDKEGLRQQQFSAVIPRYHKHYVLPSSASKRLQTSSKTSEAGPKYKLGKPRPYGSGAPPSKTLCWHLASETKSDSIGASNASMSENTIASTITPGTFCLSDAETGVPSLHPIPGRVPLVNGGPNSSSKPVVPAAAWQDSNESAKSLPAYKSFGNGGQREIPRNPARSKSMLSALFGKSKSSKHKIG
ncbi:protein ABIL1 isoform X2 [Nymphaea colorata]|uniref:protein ABIL1 isoform X2 n=1 Tax=Nymphaea colorata TaxID=210225 RepID=UPI00129EF81E|nr:protein ABIL1 isoform X2 [Nymphaea colorata]